MLPLLGLYGAHPFWIWAAVAGALLAAEVASGSGWLLWPSASAALVAVLTLAVGLSGHAAILTFVGVTIASTLLGRRLFPRAVLTVGHNINDPVGRLIGHHGKAVAAFAGGEGRVFVDGKEWAAGLDGAEGLAAGDAVEVTGVSGARLTVRPAR